MSDNLKNELYKYYTHSMHAKQFQVAELVSGAIDQIESLAFKLKKDSENLKKCRHSLKCLNAKIKQLESDNEDLENKLLFGNKSN